MEDCYLIWYLRQLSALLRQRGKAHAQEEGVDLSLRQRYVLDYLFSRRGGRICATDIHEQVGASKASISGILKSLRQEGLVEFEGNPSDDRKKWIVVTDRALKFQQMVDESVAQEQRLMCRGIPPEKLEIVKECLAMMIQNLKTETARRNQDDKDIVKAGKTV